MKINITDIQNCELLTSTNFAKSLLTDFSNCRKKIIIASYVFDIRNLKETPYTAQLVDTLIFCKEKKIEIQIFLNGYKNSGGIKKINTNTCLFFLNKHIPCQLFDLQRILHSKIALIDDNITYLGSHNLTEASFTTTFETTLKIESEKLNNTLNQLIETEIEK